MQITDRVSVIHGIVYVDGVRVALLPKPVEQTSSPCALMQSTHAGPDVPRGPRPSARTR